MSERSVRHDTIVLKRAFAAVPARVFAAWASAAARRRWAVPGDGWVLTEDQDDFRVGGREVSRFGPADDPTAFRAVTNYLDIVPGRRIVMAGTMETGGRRISASMATVEVLADGGGAMLVYTEQAAFLDGLDAPGARASGWAAIFDKLADELGRDRD